MSWPTRFNLPVKQNEILFYLMLVMIKNGSNLREFWTNFQLLQTITATEYKLCTLLFLLECKGRTVFLRRFLAKPGSWTQQHAPFLVSLWNFSSPLRRKTHQIQCRGPENGTASYKRAKKKTHFIFKANKTFFYDEYHIYHKTVTLYTL